MALCNADVLKPVLHDSIRIRKWLLDMGKCLGLQFCSPGLANMYKFHLDGDCGVLY